MFIEPQISKRKANNSGWIEVICGSMFSGKTEELIRRLNRARFAKQNLESFKPALDTRFHDSDVVSHDENAIRSTPVQFANDILLLAGNSDVVGIDEAQFFDVHLVDVVTKLADQGKRVIIAGLDMDYLGEPFGPMPALMAVAEFVTKVHPICIRCGAIAVYSHRLTKDKNTVVVGEKETYEPLCRVCYNESEKHLK